MTKGFMEKLTYELIENGVLSRLRLALIDVEQNKKLSKDYARGFRLAIRAVVIIKAQFLENARRIDEEEN